MDEREWIREGMTEAQHTKMTEMGKKLLGSQNLEIPDITRILLAMDGAIRKLAKKKGIKWPKWTPGRPLGDHPYVINQNLFIFYPYHFDSEQFIETVQAANKDGFKVAVDSISSRAVGANVRVVFWKPQKKKAAKD